MIILVHLEYINYQSTFITDWKCILLNNCLVQYYLNGISIGNLRYLHLRRGIHNEWLLTENAFENQRNVGLQCSILRIAHGKYVIFFGNGPMCSVCKLSYKATKFLPDHNYICYNFCPFALSFHSVCTCLDLDFFRTRWSLF